MVGKLLEYLTASDSVLAGVLKEDGAIAGDAAHQYGVVQSGGRHLHQSVTIITTITIYFINPSGKLKLSFDRTTKNISQIMNHMFNV